MEKQKYENKKIETEHTRVEQVDTKIMKKQKYENKKIETVHTRVEQDRRY